MAPLPGVPENIALLQGPLVLGYLFSYALQGILVVQIYLYYINFVNDKTLVQALVWTVFFVECLGTTLATHSAWRILGAGWGDLEVLIKPVWSFATLPPICGYVAMCVHTFFCWRIWKLGQSHIMPAIIFAVSLIQCGTSFYTGYRFATLEDIRTVNILQPYYIVWLGGCAFCDTAIAATMVTFLCKARGHSQFPGTNAAIHRLLTLTVETGLITALTTLLEVVLLLVFKHNNMHFLICIMLTKLYSNTMLATLNARAPHQSPVVISSAPMASNNPRLALWSDIKIPAQRLGVGLNGIQITTTTFTDALRNAPDKVWLDAHRLDYSASYDMKRQSTSTE